MYLVFDCETTGLDPQKNRILTCSFIILDSKLNDVDKLSLGLKHDGSEIDQVAMEKNGINLKEHQEKSLEISDARADILDFLARNRAERWLIPVGHNIGFDVAFLKNSGLLTPSEYSRFIGFSTIDTMIIAEFLRSCGNYPKRLSSRLSNVAKHFQISFREDRLHGAEYDAALTAQVFKKMVEKFRPILAYL